MGEIIVAKYNAHESKITFVGVEFTPGQSTYHFSYKLKFNDLEHVWKWDITPATNKLPALRVGASAGFDSSIYPLAYFWLDTAHPQWLLHQFDYHFGIYGTLADAGIASATLVESSGDTIGNFDIAYPWTATSGKTLYGTQERCEVEVEIEADFPIFCSELHDATPQSWQVGDAYAVTSQAVSDDAASIANCVSGDMSAALTALNYQVISNTIPRNKIYFIKNILKKNGTVVEAKHYRFKIPPDAKIWLVAEEHDNSGQSYNMRLYMQGLGLPPTFMWQVGGSGTSWTTAHILTSTLINYYYGEWTNFSNGDWYKVVGMAPAGNTNIPVFTDEATAEKYAEGLIGEDAAVNSGDLGYDGKITTGDDLSSSDIPSPVIAGSGAGVNVWLLDKGNLNAIFADLYDDTQSVIDDIKDGTWLWGNNPIDFIVSIYYVPFDVSSFYDTRQERVWLGHYDTGHDYTQAKETKSSGQRITLVNQTIDQVYGDWRDLDFFKYELFLPYIGFVPLDPQVYVGHTLTVELAFDVMTHNIRYYLFSDGVVTDRVDGSVGYAIPVTGTDMVNKANQNISGIVNTVKGGAELVGGVATGNLGMGATGALDTFNGIRNMMSYPKEIIRGDISASMNIFDINYVYLKITEKQSIYPPEIRQVYNNPSYVCCKLSELSGYCELQDVQLKSSCTEEEYREIIQLLKEGVIF